MVEIDIEKLKAYLEREIVNQTDNFLLAKPSKPFHAMYYQKKGLVNGYEFILDILNNKEYVRRDLKIDVLKDVEKLTEDEIKIELAQRT